MRGLFFAGYPHLAAWTTRGLALSAVAGTVATNYQTCHENAEQLRALQAWVRNMAASINQWMGLVARREAEVP
jgi:hypothetical protein